MVKEIEEEEEVVVVVVMMELMELNSGSTQRCGGRREPKCSEKGNG